MSLSEFTPATVHPRNAADVHVKTELSDAKVVYRAECTAAMYQVSTRVWFLTKTKFPSSLNKFSL